MKNFIIYFFIIIAIIFSIFFFKNTNKNKNIKNNLKENIVNKENNPYKKYNYYKKENLDRYKKYKENNNALEYKDVVIRVNLSLDKDYYNDTKKAENLNTEKVLVNKFYYLDENYVPDNLEKLDLSYSRSGMMLVKNAKDSLEEMIKSIEKDSLKLRVISSYRSYNYQVNLYNKYVQEDGKEAADTYSARPGYSEHQTGLCMDVDDTKYSYTDFEKSESFNWMQENSYKYGFILRYPKGKENITGYSYESWHYRYVGKEAAEYIKKHNITFDEYYAMFIESQ